MSVVVEGIDFLLQIVGVSGDSQDKASKSQQSKGMVGCYLLCGLLWCNYIGTECRGCCESYRQALDPNTDRLFLLQTCFVSTNVCDHVCLAARLPQPDESQPSPSHRGLLEGPLL